MYENFIFLLRFSYPQLFRVTRNFTNLPRPEKDLPRRPRPGFPPTPLNCQPVFLPRPKATNLQTRLGSSVCSPKNFSCGSTWSLLATIHWPFVLIFSPIFSDWLYVVH